ncbi:MAG: hypothetical protein K2P14_03140 [Anaeroplasmataceae bacterium]|nr:hypothetical protein [Anaeroplasmataceae bacterium]
MSKFTYGERKAFGRGVKCGFAKGLKTRKHKTKRSKRRNNNNRTTNNHISGSRDDCWYL